MNIVLGTRVTLREEAIDKSRIHLRYHAHRGDLGIVVQGSHAAWPDWIHVKFDGCRTVHRLTKDEVSVRPIQK